MRYLNLINIIRTRLPEQVPLSKVEEARPEFVIRAKETMAESLMRKLNRTRDHLKENPQRVGYYRNYQQTVREVADKLESLFFDEPNSPVLVTLFEELLSEGQNNVKLTSLMIRHLLDRGQREKALGLYRPVAKVFPGADVVQDLAANFPEVQLSKANGRTSGAVFSQKIVSKPISPEIFHGSLVAFNRLCDNYIAGTLEDDLITFCLLNEHLNEKEFVQEKIDFWLLKAHIMNSVDTKTNCIHLFRKLLILGNGDPEVAATFACYLATFRAVLESEPLKNGHENEFATFFDLVVDHTYVGPNAMFKRAEVYYRIGMYPEARELILNALDLYPRHLEVLFKAYSYAKKMALGDVKQQVLRMLEVVRIDRPWDYAAQADPAKVDP